MAKAAGYHCENREEPLSLLKTAPCVKQIIFSGLLPSFV